MRGGRDNERNGDRVGARKFQMGVLPEKDSISDGTAGP